MSYDSKLLVDTKLFEKTPILHIGSVFLDPLSPEEIQKEITFYYMCSSTEGVKKYLPSSYTTNLENAEKKLYVYISRMSLQLGILYRIRLEGSGITIGYIYLTTALGNREFSKWMLDFWLWDKYEGNGIMTTSIINILDVLHDNKVPEIYSIVNSSNRKSKQVLNSLGFELDDNSGFSWEKSYSLDKPLVYRLSLK